MRFLRRLDPKNLATSSQLVETMAAYGLITVTHTRARIDENIALALTVDDEMGDRFARGIVSSIFEDERIVGPTFAAIEELADIKRLDLFARALRASDLDDMTTHYMLSQIAAATVDLSAATKDSILTSIRSADPSNWFMSQHGVQSYFAAVRAAVSFCGDAPIDGAIAPASWSSLGEIAFCCERARRSGLVSDHEMIGRTFAAFVGDHRAHALDALFHLRAGASLAFTDVPSLHEHLVATFPRTMLDLVSWSLQHHDELLSCFRYTHRDSLLRYAIDVLGRIGTPDSIPLLDTMRTRDDVGRDANSAVRLINERAASALAEPHRPRSAVGSD